MRLPNDEITVTGTQLIDEQGGARTHLTFLLTLACPLKCEHCIVDAGPDKGHTTMPLEVAERYAAQMPAMYDRGIRLLSLTGGEPFLAKRQLKVMSEGGVAAGMQVGVVTSAHWAHSPEAAAKMVAEFPAVTLWDMSLDAYHLNYVPYERIKNAYLAAKAAGRHSVIRFTFHEPLTDADREVMEIIDGFADPADVLSSKMRMVGRAASMPCSLSKNGRTLIKPCMTKGLVVRYDGTTAPCCVSLVEERRHPFQFGDSSQRPLAELHAEYMVHPLLQMIRVLGLGEVVDWVHDAGMGHLLPAEMPEDVCDLCPHLMTNRAAADLINAKCHEPETRLKIAVLADRILHEPEMLERSLIDLSDESGAIGGFGEAQTYNAQRAQLLT